MWGAVWENLNYLNRGKDMHMNLLSWDATSILKGTFSDFWERSHTSILQMYTILWFFFYMFVHLFFILEKPCSLSLFLEHKSTLTSFFSILYSPIWIWICSDSHPCLNLDPFIMQVLILFAKFLYIQQLTMVGLLWVRKTSWILMLD